MHVACNRRAKQPLFLYFTSMKMYHARLLLGGGDLITRTLDTASSVVFSTTFFASSCGRLVFIARAPRFIARARILFTASHFLIASEILSGWQLSVLAILLGGWRSRLRCKRVSTHDYSKIVQQSNDVLDLVFFQLFRDFMFFYVSGDLVIEQLRCFNVKQHPPEHFFID